MNVLTSLTQSVTKLARFSPRHIIVINPKFLQFFHKNSLIQFGYGMWIFAGNVLIGVSFGFSATSVPGIRQDVTIEASTIQLAWFTSVLYIPSVFGCLISGFMLDKFGRKRLLMWSMTPFVIGWTYTALSPDITNLVIARAITGFAIGMCSPAARVFAAEISMPHMRSFIGTFVSLSIALGIMIQASLGTTFSWRKISYVYVGYSVVIMFSYMKIPESPYYLLMLNTDTTPAFEALQKFRTTDYDVQGEIDDMEHFKRMYNIHRIPFKNMMKALFRRDAYAPFFIIMTSIVFTQLSGVSIMYSYTVDILEDSMSSVDSYVGNAILGSTRLVGSIVCSIALFHISRRKMAIFSGLGMCISFISLFLHLILAYQPTMLPMFCTLSYVFFSTLGFMTIPLMMAGESYPLQIRGLLSGITVALTMTMFFFVNMMYPIARDLFSFPYVIISFAGFSFLACVYYYFALPEMSKLKLHEIEEFYRKAHERESRTPSFTN